jgi:hypothetical protein
MCTSTPSFVRLGADDVEPVVQVVQLTWASTYDGRHALPAAHREAIIPT